MLSITSPSVEATGIFPSSLEDPNVRIAKSIIDTYMKSRKP
jgi:hypothetical protein